MATKQNQPEWLIVPEVAATTDVRPDSDHDYDLLNLRINEALYYSERRFGINLSWTDPSNSNNVRFAVQGGGAGPIAYGSMVAINIRRGGWLIYKQRSLGINLGWSDSPVYEWRIDPAAGASGAIALPAAVGLWNQVAKDWVMYGIRDFGINLRWSADRDAVTLGGTLDYAKAAKGIWDKIF
jgi:hypothetical protein